MHDSALLGVARQPNIKTKSSVGRSPPTDPQMTACRRHGCIMNPCCHGDCTIYVMHKPLYALAKSTSPSVEGPPGCEGSPVSLIRCPPFLFSLLNILLIILSPPPAPLKREHKDAGNFLYPVSDELCSSSSQY